MKLDLLVGSGGVLSHAPRRVQAMMMMIDAFAVEGVTELAVDSIFMMPHLGVLSTIHPAAATEVFEKDCLVYLGTCIAPVGPGKPGQTLLELEWKVAGERQRGVLQRGELRRIALPEGVEVELRLAPVRGIDVGAGPGEPVQRTVRSGIAGLVLDGRGRRPFAVPLERAARVAAAQAASSALGLYP